MKTTFLTLALAASSLLAAAQSKPVAVASASRPVPTAAAAATYQQSMLAAIAEQATAKTTDELLANAAKLEAAAAAAPKAWEPRYYQARSYSKMGTIEKEPAKKDQAFAQAQAALDQAKKLPGADQAEVLVLQAVIYQGMMMADPATRAEKYSALVTETLKQAKALSPANPRLHLLLGNDLYYCPAEYGGGPDKARPVYEQAKALFGSFKPATALSPVWGEKTVDAILAKIGTATAANK